MHREQLEHGLSHDGGPPYWGRQEASRKLVFARKTVGRLVYGWMDLRRRLKGQPTYKAPKPWRIGAFVVLRDQGGEILWVKRGDYDVWNLPGGRAECDEAPWETAVRETREETGLAIRLTHLSGVYVKPVENTMVFTFIAEAIGGQLTTGLESVEFGRFPPGQEPVNSLPKHITRVADASSSQGTTVFRIQDGPPGLELLGLM
jgi:ADP-ribose pyrophosphatase YjhB (NUDIX family)